MRFSYCIFDTFRVLGGRVRLAVRHCPMPGASALHWAAMPNAGRQRPAPPPVGRTLYVNVKKLG